MSDDYEKPKEVIDERTGLPEMSDEQRDKGGRGGKIFALMFPTILTAIGYGVAYGIYKFGDKEKYDGKIAIAKELEAQWMILGLILFTFTVG